MLIPIIQIKAQANRHVLFLLLVGVLILALTMIANAASAQHYRLVVIFFSLLALIFIITSIVKFLEPKYSMELTPQGIYYHHKYGHWQVTWQQIHTCCIVKEVIGLNMTELPYIGIKLTNIDVLAEQISPRLANRLIHEQKPLLRFALMQRLTSFDDIQLNFEPFALTSAHSVKGPLAAFMHHSQVLHNALGYHLFIPETSIDRDLVQFCQLLQQCKVSSADYASSCKSD